MRGFFTELEVPARLQIELRTRGRQLPNTRRTFFDEDLDCLGVSEGGTCRQCVLPVQLRRITSAERSRDSSLSVRGGAVEQRPLGENHHIAVSGGAPRGVKTSNSAPHNQKARSYSLGHALKSTRDVRHLKGPPEECFRDPGESVVALQAAA